MKRHLSVSLTVLTVVTGTTACATKGFVNTSIADRTEQVEQRVAQVERTLEDTAVGTGRNAAQIQEVDSTATDALDTANAAVTSSRSAHAATTDLQTRTQTLEAASRRLLFEVVLANEHGQFGSADASVPKPAWKRLKRFS